MSRNVDLTKTVYELTQEYPELIDIMKELGFTEITKPGMLQSVGRMMTIPKGAKMKNISMMDVVMALLRNGFTPVGEMPMGAMGGTAFEKQEISGAAKAGAHEKNAETEKGNDDQNEKTESRDSTTEQLKSYLRRLGAGEDLESVRADFVKNFSEVEASEIMKAEQELMREGTPIQEVQKLCDVHSALFHGTTREEKIANAELEVEASLQRQKEAMALAASKKEAYSNKQELAGNLKAIEGHPVNTLSKENEEFARLLKDAEEKLENGGDFTEDLNGIRKLAVHYAKKGDLLYPVLKVNYQISGPSDIMWTVDDEIRDELGALAKSEVRDDEWTGRLKAVITRAEEMIYKEENILFPITAVNFTEDEWIGIYHDSKDYEVLFGIESVWEEAEAVSAEKKNPSGTGKKDDEIFISGGHLTIEQLTAMLNTIPLELTFVDDQNMNRYFNEGPKVFKRPQMAIDREVFSCHPPKIEPMVRAILEDFRAGKRDQVPVWMEKQGKPFLVTYMAVRDKKGTYLGTVEVVQDMSFAKEHFCG